MTAVGFRVRRLREDMNLSLRDLSQRSGVSAPMLSQVERGETSPTLTVAQRIAAGLNLSLSQLLRLDEAPPVTIVRSTDRRSHRRGGHAIELLTPDLPGQRVAVAEHSLEPAAAIPASDARHEAGSREVLVVLDGALRLRLGGVEYDLERGDSATFDSDLDHHVDNPHDAPARFLSVVTAGLRQT